MLEKNDKARFLDLYAKAKVETLSADETKELETLRCKHESSEAADRAKVVAAQLEKVEAKTEAGDDRSYEGVNKILCSVAKSTNVVAPTPFIGQVWQDLSGQSQIFAALDGAGAIYKPTHLETFPVPYIADTVTAVETAEGDYVTTEDGESNGTPIGQPSNGTIVLGANYWQTGHIRVSNKFRRGANFDVLGEIRKVSAKRINKRLSAEIATLIGALDDENGAANEDSINLLLSMLPGDYVSGASFVMSRSTGLVVDNIASTSGDRRPFDTLGTSRLKGLPVVWLDDLPGGYVALINMADCLVGRMTPAEDIKVITELYSATDETAYQYGIYGDFAVKEANAGKLIVLGS